MKTWARMSSWSQPTESQRWQPNLIWGLFVMEKQRTEINRKEGIVARGEKVRRKSIGDEARDGQWKSYCIFHHKYFGFLSEWNGGLLQGCETEMTWSDFHSQRISWAALWAINCRDCCNNPEEQRWWLRSVWQTGGRWEVGICIYFGDRAQRHFQMNEDVRGWDSQEYLGFMKNDVSTLSWDEDHGWRFRLKEGNSEFIVGLLNLKHLLDIPGEILSRHWTL